MDHLSYLVAAYTAVWIVFFAFLMRLQRRERSLRQELELLQQKLAEEQDNSG